MVQPRCENCDATGRVESTCNRCAGGGRIYRKIQDKCAECPSASHCDNCTRDVYEHVGVCTKCNGRGEVSWLCPQCKGFGLLGFP
ncbi:hypothetical protein BT63DRAFT_33253 [Microthyrium microscopicum]|uniref:CR-type domain-containing protein n=1 Tax=Microthyrium microscopicum TaxID=703497 RepID=A0A6A6USM8_9PEZI|nr:hypothetical protein BT63DRAFT_33253 [Microthyrium microscopicum]